MFVFVFGLGRRWSLELASKARCEAPELFLLSLSPLHLFLCFFLLLFVLFSLLILFLPHAY